MERNEKIQLLLDMQEHPEQFSEQALTTMLDDPEVRKLMEATALLKQAMMNEESHENDIDAKWQRFAQAHLTEKEEGHVKGTGRERSWLKIAASFIGILMVSGIAVAAIHLWGLSHDTSAKDEESEYKMVSDTVRKSSHLPLERQEEATPVRYDEATLEQILTDMADYYGLRLNWKSDDARTLRLFYIWNRQQSAVEVIRSLNSFERIRLELNDSILTADIQTNSPRQ